MNFKKTWKRANDGFTLVELIVVIAILAILAGIAVPAYSGYIKKANKAADLQLLGAVNTAFAAAVLENGDELSAVPSYSVNPRWGALTDSGKPLLGVSGTYDEAFGRYYAGNTSSLFKQITTLVFVNGRFVDPADATAADGVTSGAYGDETLYYSQADADALRNSGYADIGVGTIVNNSDLASNVISTTNDKRVQALVYGEGNQNALAQYLGFKDANAEGASAAIEALTRKKAEQLAAEKGGTAEDYLAEAGTSLMGNSAILAATTNSNFNASDFAKKLADGTAKDAIKGNLTDSTGDTQMGLSQAAFTYAMYVSYKTSKGESVDGDVNILNVTGIVDDPGFMNYVGTQASTDIAGYEAAMNIISSSAQNQTVVSDVLINGFNTTDMNALLNGVFATTEAE